MISNKITCCCGAVLNGQVFAINPGRNVAKALVYVNWCKHCGAKLAEVRKVNRFGQEKIEIGIRTGDAAEKLHEKHAITPVEQNYTIPKGSKVGEYILCNCFGNIFNLNGRYICSHDKFLAVG